MPLLFGLTGKAGAGKDTVADHLWFEHLFTKMSFADPLKRAAAHIFGVPVEDFYDRTNKEMVSPVWGMTNRRLLQLLGTDAMHGTFGKDFWLRRLKMQLDEVIDTHDVVISDCRFDTEASFVRAQGGRVIHIERPSGTLVGADTTHSSEAGIARMPDDIVIINDGTLHDLYVKVDAVVSSLRRY